MPVSMLRGEGRRSVDGKQVAAGLERIKKGIRDMTAARDCEKARLETAGKVVGTSQVRIDELEKDIQFNKRALTHLRETYGALL